MTELPTFYSPTKLADEMIMKIKSSATPADPKYLCVYFNKHKSTQYGATANILKVAAVGATTSVYHIGGFINLPMKMIEKKKGLLDKQLSTQSVLKLCIELTKKVSPNGSYYPTSLEFASTQEVQQLGMNKHKLIGEITYVKENQDE